MCTGLINRQLRSTESRKKCKREFTEVLDGVAEGTSEGLKLPVGRGDGRMPSMDLRNKVLKRPPDQKGVPKWSISRGVDVRFKSYYSIGVSERACSGRDTRLRPTIACQGTLTIEMSLLGRDALAEHSNFGEHQRICSISCSSLFSGRDRMMDHFL